MQIWINRWPGWLLLIRFSEMIFLSHERPNLDCEGCYYYCSNVRLLTRLELSCDCRGNPSNRSGDLWSC